MIEEFRDVKGYEGLYQISNLGILKRLLKYRKHRSYQEKILKPGKDKDGYYRTVLCDKEKRKSKRINRLVAIAFLENKENKPCVNHIDGIKTNNNVTNLEWCTVRENNIHAIKLGLSGQAPGEKHHMAKLSQKQVDDIIRYYSDKEYTQKELGKKYNISQTQISRIVNKKRFQCLNTKHA